MIIVLYVISLLFLLQSSYTDVDLGWHLYLGKSISDSHRLIEKLDGYSVFKEISLVDHEWLSDVLMYSLYTKLTYLSLMVVSLIILILTLYIIYKFNIRQKVNNEISLLSLLILLLPLSISFGVRLQIILLLATAILTYIPKKILKYRNRLIAYFFIFLVGGNLHGGFLALSIIPLLLETYSLRRKILTRGMTTFLIIFFALTINPYGFGFWRLAIDYLSNTYYQTYIEEWRSAFQFPVLFFSLVFPLSLYLFFLTIYGYWKKIEKNELLLVLIFLILGLKHVRMFPIFAIVITPYFARALEEIIKVKTIFHKKLFLLLAFPLIQFTLLAISNINYNALIDPFSDKEKNLIIAKVHEYYKQDTIFLNTYGLGGYIVWTNPDIKVFIDGRGPQTKVGDSTLLEEYYKYYDTEPKIIKEQLKKYNVSLVLTEKRSIDSYDLLNKHLYKYLKLDSRNMLIEYLDSDIEWDKKFESDKYVLYQKI